MQAEDGIRYLVRSRGLGDVYKRQDQENPAVECPVPMNPYTTDAGSCEATLSFAATSTDNCGIASTTYSVGTSTIAFPYDFPVGSTVVNAVVTDIHGNMSSCSFTVEVIDQTAPMVTCPVPANPYTADEGDCDATLTLNAVATDNCGVASIAYSINAVSYTHLRAHETVLDLVCRLLLEKKQTTNKE